MDRSWVYVLVQRCGWLICANHSRQKMLAAHELLKGIEPADLAILEPIGGELVRACVDSGYLAPTIETGLVGLISYVGRDGEAFSAARLLEMLPKRRTNVRKYRGVVWHMTEETHFPKSLEILIRRLPAEARALFAEKLSIDVSSIPDETANALDVWRFLAGSRFVSSWDTDAKLKNEREGLQKLTRFLLEVFEQSAPTKPEITKQLLEEIYRRDPSVVAEFHPEMVRLRMFKGYDRLYRGASEPVRKLLEDLPWEKNTNWVDGKNALAWAKVGPVKAFSGGSKLDRMIDVLEEASSLHHHLGRGKKLSIEEIRELETRLGFAFPPSYARVAEEGLLEVAGCYSLVREGSGWTYPLEEYIRVCAVELPLIPFKPLGNGDDFCFDLSRRRADGECPIVKVDHELYQPGEDEQCDEALTDVYEDLAELILANRK